MDGKLFYYSKSADKFPGKGINEHGCEKCLDLARVYDWRKLLSNFHISPFVIDGKTYNSVEHYYHSMKYRKTSPKFADSFTLESKSKICEDPLLAKKAGGKSGGGIRPDSCVLDPQFFGGKVQKYAFLRGMFAKFTQNIELGKILLMTREAELHHGTRGVPPQRIYELECVRAVIRENYESLLDVSLGEFSKTIKI